MSLRLGCQRSLCPEALSLQTVVALGPSTKIPQMGTWTLWHGSEAGVKAGHKCFFCLWCIDNLIPQLWPADPLHGVGILQEYRDGKGGWVSYFRLPRGLLFTAHNVLPP